MMNLKAQANKLNKKILVFAETKRRRVLIGELSYNNSSNKYEFVYNEKYISIKQATPLGPEFPFSKTKHISKKGQLFPSLLDRIPERKNPAYKDYCKSQGISIDEKDLIILLGTIGRKGPSSLIFELVDREESFTSKDVKEFRKKLGITIHDFALAFDISEITLIRIETNKSKDKNILQKIEMFNKFPDTALWQIKKRRPWIHSKTFDTLVQCFTT